MTGNSITEAQMKHETRDGLRHRVLRLLGESATRRNQIAQADSYLAGIERERVRLIREEEKTRKDRAANVIRVEECDRERAGLEEKLNATENR